MTPEAVLGPALAGAVLELVRQELQRAAAPAAPARSPWMTPPAAARHHGVPVKTIRALVANGRIKARLRNASENPKQKKYLVNIDEVAAALEDRGPAQPAPAGPSPRPIDLEERAARIRARSAGR